MNLSSNSIVSKQVINNYFEKVLKIRNRRKKRGFATKLSYNLSDLRSSEFSYSLVSFKDQI